MRDPLSSSRIRSSRLSVRASPDELERWSQTARFLGHATTADWVRTLLQDAVLSHYCGGKVSHELRQLRGELGRIGNNLNQLAHAAHLGDAVACGDTLQDIDRLKDRTDHLLRGLRPVRVQRVRSVSVPLMH
ncbi:MULTISPECIES: MobC family plasmid mobilization relaxosome protein [Gluconobacter]|uniref:MobC family plasmid mobilization relaxosome protein n=1 Tax=Gluconobacter cadivus TaxID=2728101 RepID=A0ABR9YTF5_9PROT|nr:MULTISPECIES: MobC family plasmid mobilization relaxosome protein [Gluconobacter]MBF0887820.1 MobC family plasmid mobilization relaxosome protein [Gluconobacter cadivus]MBS1058413.1 MobC family plasmid mobilization relaxosome protein [Gluconobacter sp. Dm-44]